MNRRADRKRIMAEALGGILEEAKTITEGGVPAVEGEHNVDVRSRRAPVCGRGRKNPRWNSSKDKHTSVVFNVDQYMELTDLAYRMKVPLKEAMYDCLAIGITRMKSKLEKKP